MTPARKKLLLVLGGVAVVGVGFVLWRRHQAVAQMTPPATTLQPPSVMTFPLPTTVPIVQPKGLLNTLSIVGKFGAMR